MNTPWPRCVVFFRNGVRARDVTPRFLLGAPKADPKSGTFEIRSFRAWLMEGYRLVEHRQMYFHASDPAEVVAEMDLMAERADGKSWLNIVPVLDEGQSSIMSERTGVAGWFTGRGSDLPLATWVPADLSGRKPEPPSLGIQHGTGSNALERFAAEGLALPESWVKQQDSGKRGIVLAVPVRIPHLDIVNYVTAAICLLIPKFDFGKRFEADRAQV